MNVSPHVLWECGVCYYLHSRTPETRKGERLESTDVAHTRFYTNVLFYNNMNITPLGEQELLN